MPDDLAELRVSLTALAAAMAKEAIVAETHLRADEAAHAACVEGLDAVRAEQAAIRALLTQQHAENEPARLYLRAMAEAAGRRAGAGSDDDRARNAFFAAFWDRAAKWVREPPWAVRSLLTGAIVLASGWLALRLGIPVSALLPGVSLPTHTQESPDALHDHPAP